MHENITGTTTEDRNVGMECLPYTCSIYLIQTTDCFLARSQRQSKSISILKCIAVTS